MSGLRKILALLLTFVSLCATNAAADTDIRAEYEALNGQTTTNGEHVYRTIRFPDDAPLAYVSFEEAFALLNEGTGVLYLGFPECPWCRTLLPALVEAVERAGYDGVVNCYNALDQRDVLSLDDAGNIVTEKEPGPEYIALRDALYDFLGPYEGLDDPSIRRIYFPTTVFVRDGEILSAHLGTVESQSSGYAELEPGLYEELVEALARQIEAVKK